MNDDQSEVVIHGEDGTEHVFPPGFDPVKAAAIVRGQNSLTVGPTDQSVQRGGLAHPNTSLLNPELEGARGSLDAALATGRGQSVMARSRTGTLYPSETGTGFADAGRNLIKGAGSAVIDQAEGATSPVGLATLGAAKGVSALSNSAPAKSFVGRMMQGVGDFDLAHPFKSTVGKIGDSLVESAARVPVSPERAFNDLPLAQQMDKLPPTPAPVTTRGSLPPASDYRFNDLPLSQQMDRLPSNGPIAGTLRVSSPPPLPQTPFNELPLYKQMERLPVDVPDTSTRTVGAPYRVGAQAASDDTPLFTSKGDKLSPELTAKIRASMTQQPNVAGPPASPVNSIDEFHKMMASKGGVTDTQAAQQVASRNVSGDWNSNLKPNFTAQDVVRLKLLMANGTSEADAVKSVLASRP